MSPASGISYWSAQKMNTLVSPFVRIQSECIHFEEQRQMHDRCILLFLSDIFIIFTFCNSLLGFCFCRCNFNSYALSASCAEF